MSACPSEDQLAREPLEPLVYEHLSGCAPCATLRRLLVLPSDLILSDEEPPLDAVDRLAEAVRHYDPSSDPDLVAEGREWLGTGATGLAFAVFDGREGRRVAVRALGTADPDHLRVTLDALGELRHPQLARPFRVVGGARAWLVRELADGQDLEVWAGAASRPRLLRVLTQITEGLRALHAAGVAHGHVLASNVFVDDLDRVKLLDAGVHPGDRAADWRALAALMARVAPTLADAHAPPHTVSRVLADLAETTDPAGGVALLGALAAGPSQSRYEIRRLIDDGGFGHVYEAWDLVLRRPVALKRLKAERALAHGSRTLLHEARLCAQIEHPGVVPVHDVQWAADGSVEVAMKLVQGRSLGELIDDLHRAGPEAPTVRTMVERLLRLTQALANTHARGAAHLDVKPKNVLVGSFGDVQLIDWGAARVVPGAGRLDPGVVPGKREYTDAYHPPLAPNEPLPLPDARTDVYALGQILHELLRGPIRDWPAGSRPPPKPWAPPELDSIAHRATSLDPASRYADAGAFALELETWLAGGQVAAHRYSWMDRVERASRPHRAALLVGVVAVLAFAVVGGVGWWATLQRRERIAREGDALAERSRLVSSVGDHVPAEVLAASAVELADTPSARGLLAQLWGRAYPTRLSCEGSTCTLGDHTLTWDQGPLLDGAPPAQPLRTAPGGGIPCGPATLRDEHGSLTLVRPGLEPFRFAGTPTAPPACDGSARLLAIAQGDEVDLWTVRPQLQEDAFLQSRSGPIRVVAWSPDGRWLAVAEEGGLVRLFQGRPPFTEEARLPGVPADGLGFARLPDGLALLVHGESLAGWDLSAVRPPSVEAMVPLRDTWAAGPVVVTIDRQDRMRTWATATRVFAGLQVDGVRSAAVSPAGEVAWIGLDGVPSSVDRAGAPVVLPVRVAAVVGFDGRGSLVVGGADGALTWLGGTSPRAVDTGEGAPDLILPWGEAEEVAVLRQDQWSRWSPAGRVGGGRTAQRIATSAAGGFAESDGGEVRVGSPQGSVTVLDGGSGAAVTALALSADGRQLAAARADQTVTVWVLTERGWRVRGVGVADLRARAALAFASGGDELLVAGSGSRVEVWDTRAFTLSAEQVADEVGRRTGGGGS